MDFEKFIPFMREVAMKGGDVSAIVDAIEDPEIREQEIKVIYLFVKAFKLSIPQGMELDRWNGFKGLLSDEEIDQILMPLIRKNLGMEDWPETS